MTDSSDAVRCWLVERTFDDRNLVTLVYAMSNGERYQRRERSATALRRGPPVPAAKRIDASELAPVPDEDTRERYAEEASRVADEYAPDDQS
ncbi:hypothetical protein [Natronosalvus halobius]|uniref:hypothetical protein n=1 Tax=Natronosalvus halobius TaxID=2953746 RepID=UPI00209CA797|nr:hypothetical protein [Natronosalvus halobius]USZ70810.1 hypothetical protein NGM15_11960 [Natronosalvus halobius]